MGRRFLKILIASVLAHGWLWVNMAHEKALVGGEWRIVWLYSLSGLFIIHQFFLTRSKPKDRSAVEEQRELAENGLRSLIQEYQALLSREFESAQPVLVRANLSLPTRDWHGRWHLKIYYSATEIGAWEYSKDETSIKWRKGCGAIGSAWKTKDAIIFDPKVDEYKSPIDSLKSCQVPIVGGIGSILAIPILRAGKVVGVMALDSKQGVDKTKFNQKNVVLTARSFADSLAPLCFSDGVA